MNDNFMKTVSETDWARIDSLVDTTIDTSDIPPLDDNFFANAQTRLPSMEKIQITLPIDADVLDWFQAFGSEYQQRINLVLRLYMQTNH